MLGCSAPDTGTVLLIGHGGSGPNAELPMNSPDAIMAALGSGMHGVELDVQLTATGELVVFHDLEVGAGACIGAVNQYGLDELASCCGQPPHTLRLDEVLSSATLKYPNAEFTLDVKLNTKDDWWTYLRTFSEAIAGLDPDLLNGRILVECKVEDFLHLLHERSPQIPIYFYADEAEGAIELATDQGYAGITIHADRITTEQVELAQANGLSVTLFGVSGNRALSSAVEKGPDRIQVDQ